MDPDTVLVSLFAREGQTLAYILRNGEAVEPLVLDVPSHEVWRIVDQLQEAVTAIRSGRRPQDSKGSLELFDYLRPTLSSVPSGSRTPARYGSALTVLGTACHFTPCCWQTAWERGRAPGWIRLPGVKATMTLARRRQEHKMELPSSIGLAVVPSDRDFQPAFVAASKRFETLFAATGRELVSRFGEQATAPQILRDANQVGYLHLLTHGKFETGRDAMRSALMVAGTDGLPSRLRPPDELLQGRLSAADFLATGISADHVTLHACSLGRSEHAHGDELWGLTRALLAAGAGTVLAPLWDVPLGSSTQLLLDFYQRRLVAGSSPSAAWGQAVHGMATSDGDYSHLHHWAAFDLFGCP